MSIRTLVSTAVITGCQCRGRERSESRRRCPPVALRCCRGEGANHSLKRMRRLLFAFSDEQASLSRREFNFHEWGKSELVAQFLRDGDLSLRRDLHFLSMQSLARERTREGREEKLCVLRGATKNYRSASIRAKATCASCRISSGTVISLTTLPSSNDSNTHST